MLRTRWLNQLQRRVARVQEHAPALHGGRHGQAGVASIEFALVFLTLFLVLYGIATFGAVLYTQQALVRAAEDGARAVNIIGNPSNGNLEADVRKIIQESLASSLIVPAPYNATPTQRLDWVKQNAGVSIEIPSVGAAVPRADIVVSYPYGANRILPVLPLLDVSQWMSDTDTLLGKASTTTQF